MSGHMASQAYALVIARRSPWRSQVHTVVRDALKSPLVVATAIICATLVLISAIGAIAWLLAAQRDVSAITAMISMLVTTVVGLLTYARVRRVEQQTNGHMTRAMDAALKDKES